MDVTAGLPFEAVFESGLIGLVPGVELAIIDNVGNVVVAASQVGIVEQTIDGNPDTGIYAVTKTAPATQGQYTLVWSTDGSFDVSTVTVEDLVVRSVSSILPPVGIPDGAAIGPCSMWADINDIANCCTIATDGVDPFVLTATLTFAMTSASEILYFASGKQFSGSCERTAYPSNGECVCGIQILSRGYVVRDGTFFNNCCSVKLAGSVREITEVTVDGVVVDPSAYEVRERRQLVRIDGSHWPCCQQECAERSFAVTYVYGKSPPQIGVDAALALACEIYKSCPISGATGECLLPTGVTRVTRQGITIERTFLQRDTNGIWRTGIAAVDYFLNTVNPAGIPRRGTVWSPSSSARYARGA